jgi:hypothetical protein
VNNKYEVRSTKREVKKSLLFGEKHGLQEFKKDCADFVTFNYKQQTANSKLKFI